MWWSRFPWLGAVARSILPVLVVAAFAGGCGFRPLYAPAGSAPDDGTAARLAAVEVDRIADREGQLLRNELLDLLNPGRLDQSSRYSLKVEIDQRLNDVALEDTGLATRANLRILARYVLVDQSSGALLTTGQSRVVTSYNITDSQFSTFTTGSAARERAMERIAHDIRRRLAAYFVSGAEPAAGEPLNPAPKAVGG